MASFLNSVQSVTVVLLLTATGYLCARLGWLTTEAKHFLNKFVMTIALPCTCVYGLTTNLTREMVARSHVLLLIPLVCIACNYAVAIVIGRVLKIPRKRFGVFIMACCMSNSLLIGYAMCRELFGDDCVPYVMLFYMVSTVYTQVVGLGFIRWAGEVEPLSGRMFVKFLTSPTVIAIVLGYILVLCNIQLPPLVASYCRYMNQITSPLALLITGQIIYEIGFRHLRVDRDLAIVIAFRFVIAPLFFILACALIEVPPLARGVFVIESAMPVVSIAVVAASEYGADEQFAAQGAAITALASFLVIPVLMVFLQ